MACKTPESASVSASRKSTASANLVTRDSVDVEGSPLSDVEEMTACTAMIDCEREVR